MKAIGIKMVDLQPMSAGCAAIKGRYERTTYSYVQV